MSLIEESISEERVLLKSGDLHIEVDRIGILKSINPLRVVYYIVRSIFSHEEFLAKPDDIVETK